MTNKSPISIKVGRKVVHAMGDIAHQMPPPKFSHIFGTGRRTSNLVLMNESIRSICKAPLNEAQ